MTTLTDAYLAALAMMETTGPRNLHSIAAFVATGEDVQVGDVELRGYLETADVNDRLRMSLALRLATFDNAAIETGWAHGSAPNTLERRSTILQLLEVDDADRKSVV